MIVIKSGCRGLPVYILRAGERIQPHVEAVVQTTAMIAIDGRWKQIELGDVDLCAAFSAHDAPIVLGAGTPGLDYPA